MEQLYKLITNIFIQLIINKFALLYIKKINVWILEKRLPETFNFVTFGKLQIAFPLEEELSKKGIQRYYKTEIVKSEDRQDHDHQNKTKDKHRKHNTSLKLKLE